MWLELFPADQRPLREDIRDVENRSEQVVAIPRDVYVLGHAGEFGVAEVGAVEDGEGVEDEDEGEEATVEFAADVAFFLFCWGEGGIFF